MTILPKRPTSRLLPTIAAALAAAALAAIASCGGDDPAAGDGGGDGGPFNGTVRVVDNAFSPRDVTISVGDSVTWRWEGSAGHTVTEGTSPAPAQDPTRLFDSPEKTSGTFGYRFTQAGTVAYFCRPHFSMGMTGTVTVQP